MVTINLFSLLIYNFYSGQIISYLVDSDDTLLYHSVEDIMDSKFKIEVPSGALFEKLEVSNIIQK